MPPADEYDPAETHPKSWLFAGLLLFLGAMMGLVIAFEPRGLDGRLRALAALLAGGGTWVALGLILFPWTRGMVAGFDDNNAMLGFKRLPPLWKAWLVLALVPTVGAFVVAVKLKDNQAAVVAPAR